ncbi:hypothetical protein CONPUDRAFT_79017 [Coniophora puteana RWD-64-598 SS2]|uniref:Pal1-domain-containing protein n=1 Tax=Coniophora puteana (strain RWD-64-598) TaxID=741705 RepID=A0A5M3N5W6_CONPW|nr:uncharacterized protein CONPUDRAFT_79017 [Coniophora puteana RWD-64-598 SS2]EIW86783.1 hypothetical protein CONPUDRAFT_79017 [Coniophora puteana RWD-64-598 SS2]
MPPQQRHVADAVRDTVQYRGPPQDHPPRNRVGRSQTQAPNTSPQHRPPYSGRRSQSQDSVLQAANAIEKSKPKQRGKKPSVHADVIDRLDFTGVGPMFHHDGPFDACAPSRNRHKTRAPMLAWSGQPEDPASNGRSYPSPDKYTNVPAEYEAPKKKVDAIAEAWGIHEPEPYEEFFAGGGTGPTPANSIYAGKEGHGHSHPVHNASANGNGNGSGNASSRNNTPQHSLGRRSKDKETRDIREVYRKYLDEETKSLQARDRERGERGEGRRGKRGVLPPPQPILVPEGNTTDFVDPSLPASGSPGAVMPGAPKRTKSLMQRIRKMRDTPNVPVGYEDASGDSPSPPPGEGGGRPTHRTQNSYGAGRYGNGNGDRRNGALSPASDEAYVYVDERPTRDKQLPATPYGMKTPPGDYSGGYFDETSGSPGAGLGRKTSLLKKVKDAVRGPK